MEWICDESTWHHKTLVVQSVYWHLAIKFYCLVYCIVFCIVFWPCRLTRRTPNFLPDISATPLTVERVASTLTSVKWAVAFSWTLATTSSSRPPSNPTALLPSCCGCLGRNTSHCQGGCAFVCVCVHVRVHVCVCVCVAYMWVAHARVCVCVCMCSLFLIDFNLFAFLLMYLLFYLLVFCPLFLKNSASN